jgi:predicted ATP-grasp superfamily ATP-dependent carboligase
MAESERFQGLLIHTENPLLRPDPKAVLGILEDLANDIVGQSILAGLADKLSILKSQ